MVKIKLYFNFCCQLNKYHSLNIILNPIKDLKNINFIVTNLS